MEGIYVITLEARPQPDSAEAAEVAGAYVNVYTTARTEEAALEVAGTEIREAGWTVVAVDRANWVTRAEVEESPDALPYFEQALLDGVVLVFHTYAHRGEEPDVLH